MTDCWCGTLKSLVTWVTPALDAFTMLLALLWPEPLTGTTSILARTASCTHNTVTT